MLIEEIADQIALYRQWVLEQPFGAPLDEVAYMEHLIVQELKAKERDRHLVEQPGS